MNGVGRTPGEIAAALLSAGRTVGQDDATVVIISLEQED
jgi:hypothetical protein